MKRTLLVLVMVLVIGVLPSCGVVMNSTYSTLLDQTAALSVETAKRAQTGTLTPADMTLALQAQANTWALFQGARDGKTPALPFIMLPTGTVVPVLAQPTK